MVNPRIIEPPMSAPVAGSYDDLKNLATEPNREILVSWIF